MYFLLNHSQTTITTRNKRLHMITNTICVRNSYILRIDQSVVLSLLGTALDNRVSQKLLGNPDYCSGATDPSFIDNCAKPINVLSQGASFDPQPEFRAKVTFFRSGLS